MQLISISEKLADRGHQVMIVYLTGACLVRPADDRISLFAARMDKGFFGLIRGFSRLRQTIRDFQPDVVHSHMAHASLASRIARITVPIPRLIDTVHAKAETLSRYLRFGLRATRALSSVTTFVSDDAASSYIDEGLVNSRNAVTYLQRNRRRPIYSYPAHADGATCESGFQVD